MKSNKQLRQLAVELYQSGVSSTKKIAERVYETFGYEKGEESLYHNVAYWLRQEEKKKEHPALWTECNEVGIPFDSVRHGWYKGKHWSIAFKKEDQDVDFEKMLKDHIEQVEQHS